MPIDADTFAFRQLGKRKRQRLAFKDNKVVEVCGYHKTSGKYVKDYCRELPRGKRRI